MHLPSSWDILNQCVDEIIRKYGSEFLDSRCGKSWDPGQMLAAVLYGPEWMRNPQHALDDAADEAPSRIIEAARNIIHNGLPEYLTSI